MPPDSLKDPVTNSLCSVKFSERQRRASGDETDEEVIDSPRTKSSKSKSVRFDTSITSITDKGQTEKEDLPSDSSDDSETEAPNGLHSYNRGSASDDSDDSDYDDEVMIREMMNTKGTDQGPEKETTPSSKKTAKEKKSGFEIAPAENKGVYQCREWMHVFFKKVVHTHM